MIDPIDVLEARAAVHEILILHLLREVFTQAGSKGPERIQRLMISIEDVLRDAARTAPESERKAAEAARQVFEHISLKLIQSLPHHGKQ